MLGRNCIRQAPLGRRRHWRCVPVPPPPAHPPPAGRPRHPARRLAACQRRLGPLSADAGASCTVVS
eukprot:1009581-Prymnesium_polylepis.1